MRKTEIPSNGDGATSDSTSASVATKKSEGTSSNRLFSPSRLKNVGLKNRIAVAPMTRTSATVDGLASGEMTLYYSEFAAGGFGLVITEGTYTDEAYSQGYANQPGLANDEQMKAWSKVVDRVHERGGRIFVQLMHAGALSQYNRFRSESIAPSAIRPRGSQLELYGGRGPYRAPGGMTESDISEALKGFSHAAELAVRAGFDGIEVHGANGYLIDEFLTSYTNAREDRYGGSVSGRVQFAVEVIRAVNRATCGRIPAGIRMSQTKVNDFDHRWEGGQRDAEIIFGALAQAPADFVHVTSHDALAPAFPGSPTLAELARKFARTPVIANGGLADPADAQDMLDKGIELISIGRGALANADWPLRVKEGRALEAFDSAMLMPAATLDNARRWRLRASQALQESLA
jgi:2,4-dienoyl-CoA reductase-like NADH-dependent reductase (Old Yellow Enzyme family)